MSRVGNQSLSRWVYFKNLHHVYPTLPWQERVGSNKPGTASSRLRKNDSVRLGYDHTVVEVVVL